MALEADVIATIADPIGDADLGPPLPFGLRRASQAPRAQTHRSGESRLGHASILALVREPLVIVDAERRIVAANAAFYRLCGADPKDADGSPLRQAGRRDWEIWELCQPLSPRPPRVGSFPESFDFADTGDKAWMLCPSHPACLEGSTALRLIAMKDVTEPARAEELPRRHATVVHPPSPPPDEFLAALAEESHHPVDRVRAAGAILGRTDLPASAFEMAQVILDRRIQHMTRLVDDVIAAAAITRTHINSREVSHDLRY